MEVTAHVFFALILVVSVIVECLDVKSKDHLNWKVVYKYRIPNGDFQRRALVGSAWRKANFSKPAHKQSCRRVAYSAILVDL